MLNEPIKDMITVKARVEAAMIKVKVPMIDKRSLIRLIIPTKKSNVNIFNINVASNFII